MTLPDITWIFWPVVISFSAVAVLVVLLMVSWHFLVEPVRAVRAVRWVQELRRARPVARHANLRGPDQSWQGAGRAAEPFQDGDIWWGTDGYAVERHHPAVSTATAVWQEPTPGQRQGLWDRRELTGRVVSDTAYDRATSADLRKMLDEIQAARAHANAGFAQVAYTARHALALPAGAA